MIYFNSARSRIRNNEPIGILEWKKFNLEMAHSFGTLLVFVGWTAAGRGRAGVVEERWRGHDVNFLKLFFRLVKRLI